MKYKAIEIYGDTNFSAGDDIILVFKLRDMNGDYVDDPSVFDFKAELSSNGVGPRVEVDDVTFGDDGEINIVFSGDTTSQIWDGTYKAQLKIIDEDGLSYVVWSSLFYLESELIYW